MPLLAPASPAGGMPQLGFDDTTICFLADDLDLDCGPAAAAASIAGARAGATSAAVPPNVVMADVTNGQSVPRHTTGCGGADRCGGARHGGVALLGRLLAPPVLEAALPSPLAAPPAVDVLQLRLVVAVVATADDDAAAAQEWQQPQQPQQLLAQQPQQAQQQQHTVTLTAPSAADGSTLRRRAASLQPGHQLLLTGLQRGLPAATADAASAGGFRGVLGGRAWTPAAVEGGGAAAVYNLSVCRAALRSTQLREMRPIASAARQRKLKRRTTTHSTFRQGGTAARRRRRRRRPRGTGCLAWGSSAWGRLRPITRARGRGCAALSARLPPPWHPPF